MLSQQLYRANEGYEPNWRAEFTKKIVIFQHRTGVFYIFLHTLYSHYSFYSPYVKNTAACLIKSMFVFKNSSATSSLLNVRIL
jgi:hypothetical protein